MRRTRQPFHRACSSCAAQTSIMAGGRALAPSKWARALTVWREGGAHKGWRRVQPHPGLAIDSHACAHVRAVLHCETRVAEALDRQLNVPPSQRHEGLVEKNVLPLVHKKAVIGRAQGVENLEECIRLRAVDAEGRRQLA
eukprot:scaffold187676_cov26-Tisochrysis_lutea.AAC.4